MPFLERTAACVAVLVVAALARSVPPPPAFSVDWAFGDANGTINLTFVHNNRLYLGGTFTEIGGIAANRVAMWDGRQFHPLGAGISSTDVSTCAVKAFASYGNRLMVAGNFTSAGGAAHNSIAAWDDMAMVWEPVGGGLTQAGGIADVRCLEAVNFTGAAAGSAGLYAGGSFNGAGAGPASNVARWNGSAWDNAGGGYNGAVNALALFNNTLFAGGTGSSANRFRFWTGLPGAVWTTAPNAALSGGSTRINTLEVFDSFLYAGGSFNSVGSVTSSPNVFRYDGMTPTAVGAGLPGIAVSTLESHDEGDGPFLAAGGNGLSPNNAARFNGQTAQWETIGNGVTFPVTDLCSYTALDVPEPERDLFAAGTQLRVKLPDLPWTSLGCGINGQFGSVTSLAVGYGPGSDPQIPPGDLYVAGVFTAAVQTLANFPLIYEATKIARVAAVRSHAGRSIRERSLASYQYIRSACGSGLSGGDPNGVSFHFDPVNFANGFVSVCGGQTGAGGQPSGGLSFYNPFTGTWNSPGVPGHTGTFEWFVPGGLPGGSPVGFAGGSIVADPPSAARYLLGVDPATGAFTGVLCGPSAAVRGCRARPGGSGPHLMWGYYPGVGCPEQATGFISTFDTFTGTSSPWPSATLNGPVLATCETGQESANPGLYVGGLFSQGGPGGATVLNRVAYWNGAAWEALGSGVDGPVNALCVWDDGEGQNLYVAGSFQNAGGQPARGIARWDGAQWSPVFGGGAENGVNGTVNAMAIVDFGDERGPSLMLGGGFTRAGGLSSGRLAQLVARGAPVIAQQPQMSVQVAPGGDLSLRVRAHRSPPLAYRWHRGGQPLEDGGRISGSGTPGLRITGATADDAGIYQCVVSNAFDSVTTLGTTVLVGVPCPADFNGDGRVDPDDLSDYIACYFGSPPCPQGDINHDGRIDPDDLSDYIAIYFTTQPGGC